MALGVLRNFPPTCSSSFFWEMGNSHSRRSHAIRIMTMTKGMPNMSHLPKETSSPIPCSAFSAIALGGVPIGVPMPPRLAAMGMARAKAARPLSSGVNRASTGVRMASIMAAVAVLLINMEKRAVTDISPRSTNLGLVPKGFKSTLARFMSSLYLVAAAARKKPPRKSMMMGSAKVAIVDFCCMVLTNCSPWMRAVISLLYRRPAAVLSWAAMDSCPAASSVFPSRDSSCAFRSIFS